MPSFWSYIKNDKHAVGCTGQTVYVYDHAGNELARFKDIIYAYLPMFCPGQNIFAVKSTNGRLAFYSLEKMQLLKKFRFSKYDAAQDNGCSFSKDGKYLYNIERHANGSTLCISTYETSTLNKVKQFFLPKNIHLYHIEYDDRGNLFVLGFMRDKNCSGFIALLEDENLEKITMLTPEKFNYIRDYKKLEMMGFTPKAKEWSSLKYNGYNLEKLEHVRLSDFINIL